MPPVVPDYRLRRPFPAQQPRYLLLEFRRHLPWAVAALGAHPGEHLGIPACVASGRVAVTPHLPAYR